MSQLNKSVFYVCRYEAELKVNKFLPSVMCSRGFHHNGVHTSAADTVFNGNQLMWFVRIKSNVTFPFITGSCGSKKGLKPENNRSESLVAQKLNKKKVTQSHHYDHSLSPS